MEGVEKTKNEVSLEESEHAEAVALVEKHRDFFEYYAKGAIKIEPAPKGLKTFAFNLETNTIYVNATLFKKVFGFIEQKTIFATMHEIEHFMEKLQVLSEDGGDKKFEKFLKRLKESKAFGLMDNCVSDIRENRKVVSHEPEGLGELERKIYKEDLFSETNFTSSPRHIQFCEALLREARVPTEKCEVSSEVRQALDKVASVKNLMDVMTHPDTPMSMRWKLQDKYIWPKVKELLEKDLEDKKKKKEEEKKKKQENGNEENDSGENGNGEEPEGGGDKNEGGKENTDGSKNGDKKGKPKKGGKPDDGKGDVGGEDDDETDPNKIFKDDYDEADKKFPEAVPLEDIEKEFKRWREVKAAKDPKELADADYAKNLGVEKKDLQEYRRIVEQLEKVTTPETGLGIMEELENLITRIISKRLKKAFVPRYPVEEGDELVDPALLVSDAKAGNLHSKSWQDIEIKEKKGQRYGEVEVTLVFDRSDSMNQPEAKRIEQRKAGVLFMEVLKKFAEVSNEEKVKMEKPLEIRSEIFAFQQDPKKDDKPLKKMSGEFGEKERIDVMVELSTAPGGTTDFIPLETVNSGISEEDQRKIKEGELKKIVIVFTDGVSNDAQRTKNVLKSLREKGIVAIGVGITESGKAALDTYAPDARLAEVAEKLVKILAELLKEHLKDL